MQDEERMKCWSWSYNAPLNVSAFTQAFGGWRSCNDSIVASIKLKILVDKDEDFEKDVRPAIVDT